MLTNPLLWAVLGLAIGYLVRQFLVAGKAGSVEQKLKNLTEEAERKSKEIVLDAKGEASRLLDEAKNEERERKTQLAKLEERNSKREEFLEKQLGDIKTKEVALEKAEELFQSEKVQLGEMRQRIQTDLEKVAKLTIEEAKTELLKQVRESHGKDLALTLQKMETER